MMCLICGSVDRCVCVVWKLFVFRLRWCMLLFSFSYIVNGYGLLNVVNVFICYGELMVNQKLCLVISVMLLGLKMFFSSRIGVWMLVWCSFSVFLMVVMLNLLVLFFSVCVQCIVLCLQVLVLMIVSVLFLFSLWVRWQLLCRVFRLISVWVGCMCGFCVVVCDCIGCSGKYLGFWC